jgi:hypothetical protein
MHTHTCLYFRSQFLFFNWYESLVHSEKINFLSVIFFFLTSIMSDLSMDKVASISHAMSVHRTMFIKPSMSHTQDKGASHSIPTCHYYGVNGHIRPNCFHIRSQKPLKKSHVPRKDEPGFEEQVKKLSFSNCTKNS